MRSQGGFLNSLGGAERAQALSTENPAQASSLMNSYTRLTHADEMGTLFKVLMLSHPGMPALPGT
jgi:SAM-dependent MidA family methyltransferase